MSVRRSTLWFVLGAALLGSLGIGCGYSEEEWQAKLKEIEGLKGELAQERDQNNRTRKELAQAQSDVDKLKAQLKALGVDNANLAANLAEQARALEEYKRRADQLEQIKKRFELLREKLQALTKLGLNVTVRNNRMVIQLPGDVLFDTGRETLKEDGKKILLQVAEVVRNDPGLSSRSFQVAGHTDSDKMQGGRYKDNWGLSVMRAREVLAFLVDPTDKGGGGLNPTKWSASGYGDTDPLKPNDSPENKQANRRCELVVVPNVEEMLDLKTLTQ